MFTLFVKNEKWGCYEATEQGVEDFRKEAERYSAWGGFYYLRPDTERAEKLLLKHDLI